ncbi:NRPS protein [Claviceps sorghi]|nr:NRPS protein [Claviceps sorghi]
MTPDAACTDKPIESGGAKELEFHVPALAKRPAHILESEILLLGWSLLMRRYGIDGTSDFTWGTCSDYDSPSCTFDFRSCNTSWTPVTPLSEALKDIQSYVQQAVSSDAKLAANGTTLYFNDECVPDHQSDCTSSDSTTVKWGNVQLRTVVRDGSLWVQPMWREPLGGAYLAKHFAQAFVEVLTTIFADLSSPISAVLKLGDVDHSVLWNWNKHLPPAVEVCIQDLITNQAQKHPTKQAICSWDGDLSYEEVERFSSLLATHLVNVGVLIGDIVPLCFEKSKWTTVAVLGVVKAGAAFVLMDPSQPIQRRKLMAQQVNARFIVTSDANGSSGSLIAPEAQTIIVSDSSMQSMVAELGHGPTTRLPFVSPDSTLYIIFTSGSTGMPKGVVIGHSVYTTSALARSTEIGYTELSRVLDFTSYAFDVSIDSMLSTLLRGGCLCIPSDEDRMNDISGAMRRLGVNMANMTPSVARILDPDIIPSLYSLGIGGEACSAGDIAIWGQHTRVVVGYGPAECTIGCTVNPNAAGKPYVSMGAAKGCTIWLVHPDDHDQLVPVGAVGELLIEGPIVGQGYLGEPEKTEAAFIRDPAWLVSGYGDVPGRRGRLYKTGDLVRYDPDGENGFIFVGRKDSQVKLRGQRVELGEIEHHIKKLLPSGTDVVAEVIAPAGQKTETMLVAFVADRCQDKLDKDSTCEVSIVEMSSERQSALHVVSKELPKTVPIYMVPSTYMAVSRIPMLVSGKIDRKTLRSLGASVPLHSISLAATAATAAAKGTRAPTSGAEKCLQAIWSTLLNLKADQIYAQANFFMLGGDSILAMKLVSAVREAGYMLTVAQVFTSPALQDMATELKTLENTSSDEVPPFSLLDGSWSREALCREAADHCGLPVASIEDIYPCAPMQEIHMAFYHRSKEAYVAQRVAEIPNADAADRLRAAWDTVIRDCPILRTRIVEFEKHGFLQVVTNDPPGWQYRDSLSDFLREDKETPMPVNSPLSRFTMVHDVSQEKHYFVWTAHHAVYDAWSTELIVDHVIQAFRRKSVKRLAEFKHFIQFLQDPEREKSKTFWLNQLDGATGRQFPELPSRSYIPEPDAQIERFIAVNRSCRNDITDSTIIRAAWALVAAQYTMNDDVVFAETFTGRSLPIPGIDQIEGPILATVPVRVRIDRTSTVYGFLQSLQDQGVTRAAHDHYGIQNIRRLSADAQVACEVSMGMVIQPAPTDANDGQHGYVPAFVGGDAALEALHFNTYPLMLACCLQPGRGFRVLASFDSRLVSKRQMQRVLTQLESAVSQLCRHPDQYVKDVSCLSRDDLGEIWSANCAAPKCASDAPKLDADLEPGDVYPNVEYVPWIVSPSNSGYLMPIGATGELLLEGGESQEADGAAPEWLTKGAPGVPGRHSRVYKTGDLVKYSDGLELIFVGRKDDMVQFQGRTIDLKAVDSELTRLLPAHVEACSRLISLDDVAGGASTTVVAFVRETDRPETGSTVQLDLDGNLGLLSTTVPIASTVSLELVQSVACLRKAMLDALPPYMIPSVCIPLSVDGDSPEKLDVTLANSLATLTMTSSHVAQIRQSFSCALSSIGDLAKMSPNEVKLRSLWARFLSVDEKTITLDDNFFRLGGDSILAMRIVSALRSEGHVLTVADMFRNMKLRDMASIVREDQDTPRSSRPREAYKAFSLLGNIDIDHLLANSIVPRLADSSWVIEDVLPVTDTQERDVKSTVSRPRSAVQYNMLHMDKSIDIARVLESFQYLVSVHPILRTVFVPHGEDTVLQVVLQALEVPVSEHDCSPDEDLGQFARKLAGRNIEVDSSFQYGQSFIQLFVLRQEEEQSLMIRISHAQYDGVSLPELLKQLDVRYCRHEAISPPAPFAGYLQHMATSEARNMSYWKTRLRGSCLSHIISPADPMMSTTRFFTRAVNVSGRSPDVTFATLLTASWATVLARQLSTSDVTFAGIVSGRNVDMAGIEQVMGSCYQYMPVRIKFEPGWTVTRLLDHVRDVYLEGSARATLGFSRISRECTNWDPEARFYTSFVNSLDQGYFDTMPFGGRPCRVDYTNPHAEPATPPRIVSFVEAGESRVGIEADAERQDFWQARLEDLATTMEFFVKEPSATVL